MSSFSFLLTERERERFNAYTTPKSSSSLTGNLIWTPLFKRLAKLVPVDISPNLLSLASALVLVQGWYFTETHGARFPVFSSIFVGFSLLLWFALDQIDEFHAANIRNDYSFVELFDHVCSSIASIFLGLTLSRIFLGPKADQHAVWYVTQIGQLVLLNKHVQALRRGKLVYSRTRGPGEGVAFVLGLLLVRTFLVGSETFDGLVNEVFSNLVPSSVLKIPNAPPYLALLVLVHFFMHVYFFLQTFLMTGPKFRATRNLLQLSVVILYLPSLINAVSRYLFGLKDFELFSEATLISDALILCVLTCDIVVCRMASRSLHPIIPVLCMVAVSSVPLTIALSAVYFLTLFFELSFHLRLPILGVLRNVYVDGIFDMVHIGHLKHFGRAAQLGTRLLVGVVNDEDATPYKRKPIMTHDERCELVAACKYVYKVIPNAPCVKGGLNEEFLKKHNIHIVGCGEEYENPEDEWYGIPRRLGMTRVLPRTQGMSTSDLIARIKQRSEKEGKEIMS